MGKTGKMDTMRLVLNNCEYLFQEEQYYTEADMNVDLVPLHEGKMMTKKQAEGELKRIKGLIASRDKFLKEHRMKVINIEYKKSRAKTSLKGRKEQKRTFEKSEYERLAKKSEQLATETIRKAAHGELVAKSTTGTKQRKEVSFDSSFGEHPLSQVLQKQNPKQTTAEPQVQPAVHSEVPPPNVCRQLSNESLSGLNEGPIATSSIAHENLDTSAVSLNGQEAVGNNNNAVSKHLRGYMKVNAYEQLCAVAKNQASLLKEMNEYRTQQQKQMKVINVINSQT